MSIRKSLLMFVESAAISILIFSLVAFSFVQEELTRKNFAKSGDKNNSIYTEKFKPEKSKLIAEVNKEIKEN